MQIISLTWHASSRLISAVQWRSALPFKQHLDARNPFWRRNSSLMISVRVGSRCTAWDSQVRSLLWLRAPKCYVKLRQLTPYLIAYDLLRRRTSFAFRLTKFTLSTISLWIPFQSPHRNRDSKTTRWSTNEGARVNSLHFPLLWIRCCLSGLWPFFISPMTPANPAWGCRVLRVIAVRVAVFMGISTNQQRI